MEAKTVAVNGRSYRWPDRPLVVICCDGSEPDYMEMARAEGLMPNLDAMIAGGENRRGLAAMPSFTNPNNLSIVTGSPPAVHGINGNYLLDRGSGQEVMMNDPRWLRAATVFEGFQKAGARVVVITAKDKLRALLGKGLAFNGTAVCFSSEKADEATLGDHGIGDLCDFVGMPVPEVYSATLSEFVLAAGAKLMMSIRPRLMYLSTTDYVQHKYAPGSREANDFYRMLDRYLGELDRAGASIVLTADHGMKNKHRADGQPDVIYLEEVLDEKFGAGKTKVILPITDPYVAHHGALGSFATVYLFGTEGDVVAEYLRGLDGIDLVLANREACARFELPADRTGDLVVISGGPRASKVIGSSRTRHDLTGLTEPLRSHGGLTEQEIPIITNRKIVDLARPLRNFDAFFIGCNHLAAAPQAA
ncbi:MAG: phosphonoacetate hydrolase [Pseudomonadota bacterium]|nr:phosphonoacetate hydrolase [Pseudomonadota bacterium]